MNIRPYIVLNDVSSQTVQGLIISSLPAITKPKIRTMIEEIDGRDGDIVTPLGFSAYDKAVEIGLSYGYDIDDVIQFFNSSGKVVFSNEPEKYYNYAIYEQINFEKLIRFKTATVVFHVQPFKYSDVEGEKTFNFSNVSSGSLQIRNNGNIYSKPTITITGSGTVNLSLNGQQIFVLNMATTGTIILNIDEMNAYGTDGTLKNRMVTGDYDDFVLQLGNNTISFTGSVTQILINNYSRWV